MKSLDFGTLLHQATEEDKAERRLPGVTFKGRPAGYVDDPPYTGRLELEDQDAPYALIYKQPFDVELRRDFEEWLKDVSFGPACPWNFEMSIDSHGFGLWLAFRWSATDRNAPMRDIPGTITGLEFKQVIPVRVRDRASFLDFVYQHAKKIFLHELDESFMVLGVRVKDPHAPYLREEYR